MNRSRVILGIVALISAITLFAFPPVGFVASVVMIVLLSPWGRSITERAVISGVVLLGVVAIVFPRAGSTPVTGVTAKLLLIVAMAVLFALSLIPAVRRLSGDAPVIPRPTLSDGIVGVLAVASGFWLLATYLGASVQQIVAGLFFSGWDNQGHFTTFANTYISQSTTWPTVDGSIAWNQWYPTLHSTVWSLAEMASQTTSATDRVQLLWPYVQWNAISFALCLAALAWLGGDIAARFGGRERARWTRPLATAAVAVFGLLGSPAFLYNSGFTNFMMAVTIVAVAAYLSARSWRSAQLLGWFLIPLATLAVIGLWTPLVLGLIPSGVVVAIALLRYRLWAGGVWLAANIVLALVLGLTQTAAILGVDPGQSTSDFTTDLGAVTTGMASFNIGLALAAPIVAIGFAVLLWRSGRRTFAIAVLGPVLGAGLIAILFSFGASAAGVGIFESYYVLKPLDAMLIAGVPLMAALASVVLVRSLSGVSRATAVISIVMAGAVLVGLFGYIGTLGKLAEGYFAAPGVQAGADRAYGIENSLIGLSIISGQEAARPYPDYTTVQWDGAGLLPNLWVASLHGTMSKADNRFYKDMPEFPYESTATGYIDLALNLNRDLRVALLWFRPSSGETLTSYAESVPDGRAISVQIPMEPNAMCPECAP